MSRGTWAGASAVFLASVAALAVLGLQGGAVSVPPRVPTFQQVSGAPDYAGHGGEVVKVKAAEDGLEYGAAGGGGGDTLTETTVASPQQLTTYHVTHAALPVNSTKLRFSVLCEDGLDNQMGGGAVPDWVLDDLPGKAGHFTVAPQPSFGVTPAGIGSILTVGAEVGTVVTWGADPTAFGSVVLDNAVSAGTPNSLTAPHALGAQTVTAWNNSNAPSMSWRARRTPGSTTQTDFKWTGGGSPPPTCTFQNWVAP